MIDHIGINCADLDAAKRFYDQTLAVLGHQRVMDFGVAIGYGTEEPDFWISGGEAAAGPMQPGGDGPEITAGQAGEGGKC